MNFKLWLEDYEQHRGKIQASAIDRQFAFAKWFPQERIYLPLSKKNGSDKDQKEIAELLKDHGYELADYNKGLAKKGKNLYKIGKVIRNIWQNDLKELQLKQDQMSERKYNYEVEMSNSYYKGVLEQFENSNSRIGKGENQYEVVISSNIHDIGTMSTDQNWTSCMNLDNGSNKKTVYCEVKKGGFVAYLVQATNDYTKELRKSEGHYPIKNAKARILIRRFTNKQGQSIAIPEESVYGDEVPGFKETVKKWIESKQGKIKPGTYRRRGGKYSDTFDPKHEILPDSTEGNILKLLNKAKNARYPGGDWEQKALALYAKKLGKKYSPEVIDGIKKILIKRPGFTNTLINLPDHPELLTQELIDKMPAYIQVKISDEHPHLSPGVKQAVQNTIVNDLSNQVDQLIHSANDYTARNSLRDTIDRLKVYKPIPEPITRKVVKEIEKVMYKLGAKSSDLYEDVAYVFGVTGTDTPTVINFYKKLLPFWGHFHGHNFLYALAALGHNGKVFLAFLKHMLEFLQKQQPNYKNKYDMEGLNYAIDSIETGKLSNKYRIF